MWRLIAVLVIGVCIGTGAFAQSKRPVPAPGKPSQPPQSVPQSGQQQSAPDRRGTENAPVIVKVLPTPKSKEEADQNEADRKDVSAANWWMVRLTGAIGFIGFVQLIVFGLQARRLKQTIKKMDEFADGQTRDMQGSINQATRAAVAMEGVAQSMAVNVENVRQSVATSKAVAEGQKLQIRAYLSVAYAGIVPQNDATMYRFEPRMQLVNNGDTPAYQVRFRAACDVLQFPLPDDFAFPLPDQVASASTGMLGPRLTFGMNAVAPRLYSPMEIGELKAATTRRLYFWGIVTYEDALQITRELTFSQSIVWMADGSTVGFNTARHNDAN